jgi:alpha-D-xyloside xylohydrolase
MPLYVREGTILPIGPEIQYTDEKPADPVTLFVYTGKDCTFILYEDEGTNYNYEKGACSTIKFSYNNESGTLTIGERKGEYNRMLKTRTFNVVWISREKPVPFDPGTAPDKTITYDGNAVTIGRK